MDEHGKFEQYLRDEFYHAEEMERRCQGQPEMASYWTGKQVALMNALRRFRHPEDAEQYE